MIGESTLTHIEGAGRFRPADVRTSRPVPAVVPVTDATAKGREGDEPFVLPERGRRGRLPDQHQPRTGASAAYQNADGLGRYPARAFDLTIDREGGEAGIGFGPALRGAGAGEAEQAPAAIVAEFAYRTADTLDAGYAHRGSIFDLTI